MTGDDVYFCEYFIDYIASLVWDFHLSVTESRAGEKIVEILNLNALQTLGRLRHVRHPRVVLQTL